MVTFSLICIVIDNDTSRHSGQNVGDCGVSSQQILTTVMARIVVDNSTNHAN